MTVTTEAGTAQPRLEPRHIAGPGCPAVVFDVVKPAGWRVWYDDVANSYAAAPDRGVIVAFLPEGGTFTDDPTALWVVRAFTELNSIAWEAKFTKAVAAFVRDLATGGPLDPDREFD